MRVTSQWLNIITNLLPQGLFFFLFSFSSSIFPTNLTICRPCFQSLFYIYRDLSLATCSILSLLLGEGLYLLLTSHSTLPSYSIPTSLCSITFHPLTISLCLGTRLCQLTSHELLLETVEVLLVIMEEDQFDLLISPILLLLLSSPEDLPSALSF